MSVRERVYFCSRRILGLVKAPEQLETLFSEILLPVSKRVSAKRRGGRSRGTKLNLKLAPLWNRSLVSCETHRAQSPERETYLKASHRPRPLAQRCTRSSRGGHPGHRALCIVNTGWRFQTAPLASSFKQVLHNQKRCQMLGQNRV